VSCRQAIITRYLSCVHHPSLLWDFVKWCTKLPNNGIHTLSLWQIARFPAAQPKHPNNNSLYYHHSDYPAHKQIKESVSLWRDCLPPRWVEHSVMCFCICAEWGSSFFQKTRLLQCKVQHLTFSGFVTSSNPVATLILQCTPEKCEADLLCVSSSAALTCSLSFPRSP
jgi:hypothetical protein